MPTLAHFELLYVNMMPTPRAFKSAHILTAIPLAATSFQVTPHTDTAATAVRGMRAKRPLVKQSNITDLDSDYLFLRVMLGDVWLTFYKLSKMSRLLCLGGPRLLSET